MAIDFNKVRNDVTSKVEPIPVSNLKPAETAVEPPKQPVQRPKAPKSPGRPTTVAGRTYTRVGFDPDVWYAMKYKKLMGDESFTDQVNNALRLYLDIKK
ncbi:MAG: hypothetical protein GX640_11620 [Fibrobacter sp.]|nr:hypothetical protein [Fibrobacter sp.]